MSGEWREIGPQIFVLRHPSYDVNAGLVVGDDSCLIIDTLSTARQATSLVEAVRSVTTTPWIVVNTHAHFDHCFGNATFRPTRIWAHYRCAAALAENGEFQRRTAQEMTPELHADLAAVVIDPPDRLIRRTQDLDLGGRTVELAYPGRGHTDHDLVVRIPDADVLFAGDLIEESGPPDFGDSFPLEWPGTLAALLPMATGAVVPGHGAVVDRGFVEHQAEQLQELADAVLGRGGTVPDFGAQTAIAVQRATWQLESAVH